ncbi:MAG TPA: hypothetical protein VGR43_00950, partial [Dehalococcoidia bacterium]|nr:hypothetical protein [Dehalococcoidia bacterium]
MNKRLRLTIRPVLFAVLPISILAGMLFVGERSEPAYSHGNGAILECAVTGTGGDRADLRGIRFSVSQRFVAVELRMDAFTAGTYTFDAELRRSTGFTAPVEQTIPISVSVPGSPSSPPLTPVHIDFADVLVSGSETFTLSFANIVGPDFLFFETTGIGNFPCPGVEETEENNVAAPTERADPAGFRVLSNIVDPPLPVGPLPICGDQDGSETPLVLNCPDFDPLTNLETLTLSEGGQFAVGFDFVYRTAGFNNEFGAFPVDDASGSVGGISPGEPGYLEAALAGATVIYASGSTPASADTFLTGDQTTYAFFLVQNGTLADLQANNPTNS